MGRFKKYVWGTSMVQELSKLRGCKCAEPCCQRHCLGEETLRCCDEASIAAERDKSIRSFCLLARSVIPMIFRYAHELSLSPFPRSRQ